MPQSWHNIGVVTQMLAIIFVMLFRVMLCSVMLQLVQYQFGAFTQSNQFFNISLVWLPSPLVHSHNNHNTNHKSSPSTAHSKVSTNQLQHPATSSSSTNTTASGTISMPKYNVRIEGGKLFYEKRWYHKDQNIYVESRETGKVSAVITTIGHVDVSFVHFVAIYFNTEH